MSSPERSLGLAGSIIKARYRINAVSSVSRDVVVYAAEELRYGRPIALKVLRDEVASDAEFVAAVREQAGTLAISAHVHRGLPRVYECGTTETGELFIALERTRGTTLREVLDARGPLDPSTALRITSQIGEAIETLHHGRILHGELGLESVLLVRDNEGMEQVTLVGVELTAAYRTTNARHRRDAASSAYHAPEQVERGETTEASDQYALGMLLRELLTAGARETAGVQTAPPAVPPEITRIITTALDAQPERRFPDISVMVNDMWAAQTALAESAPRPRVVEARAKSRRRHHRRRPEVRLRIAAAVATATVIAAAAWFALSGTMLSRARALVTTPEVTAVPVVEKATPLAVQPLRSDPVPVAPMPPTPPAVREKTMPVRESAAVSTVKNASTAESLAHPSAAPRPAPLVERQDRPVEAAPPAERSVVNDQPATDGGDGAAIIDWVLNRRR